MKTLRTISDNDSLDLDAEWLSLIAAMSYRSVIFIDAEKRQDIHPACPIAAPDGSFRDHTAFRSPSLPQMFRSATSGSITSYLTASAYDRREMFR